MELYYGEMTTPVGPMTIISDGMKAVRIDYGSFAEIEGKTAKWTSRFFSRPVFIEKREYVEHIIAELDEYFVGERINFTFDFDFYGTPFQKEVWRALYNKVPYGETKSYKEIAQAIGNPKAVRAIGGGVNKNPLSIVVPCHRVIGTNGKMIGYGGGLEKKEYLLAHEAK
ncbi:methylated-DNA-[protein]-cysteine S-methyltransferase/epoxyqueuosine reductase [Lentibacillus persicus]|uniref:Methylated-DNA--protein-cysteine methyltransferase n=1 Tax=Lentibacillus persicus TaxID=640948 RepID=A0A1I1X6L7_9BACI|nr:methylated-DNA--[protein]-cysteine S-methyltransferase [Lentibacillus persicus]SFE00970.1 methylated-DNA-[protein]-cysteine S-methyltransferase/epoxyqueuosine reductase [Lentibacillus persicus]